MIAIFLKIKNSIFTKLLLVLLITGFLVNVLVMSFFKVMYSNHSRQLFHKNVSNYLSYIIKDLGTPPKKARAEELAREFAIQIRFEGEEVSWATSRELLSIDELQNIYCRHGANHGWYRGRFFTIKNIGSDRYLFASDFKQFMDIRGELIAVLIVLLTLILAATYYSIRKILNPITLLNEGVRQVSQGNLKHLIPVSKKDELGHLAGSFNSMTKRIREMIHSKEQLLMDVSHELRSPLTRAKLGLEMIPDSPLKKSVSDDIEEMGKMIGEILETSNMDSKNGGLKREPTDALELIHEAVKQTKNQLPGIRVKNAPESLQFMVDREKMKMAVNNILDNALKYSKPDSKPVEIVLTQEGKKILIKIIDYGVGIAEDDVPYIFEPFYRVDRSRTRETGGYGLGMSICKKIMEAHGGTIELSSTVQVGTTVKLTLPQDQ